MFKKIENYNEVAEMVKTEKLRICVYIGHRCEGSFEDLKAFKRFLKIEYIEEAMEAILNYGEYKFDEEVELKFQDRFGCELTKQ